MNWESCQTIFEQRGIQDDMDSIAQPLGRESSDDVLYKHLLGMPRLEDENNVCL